MRTLCGFALCVALVFAPALVAQEVSLAPDVNNRADSNEIDDATLDDDLTLGRGISNPFVLIDPPWYVYAFVLLGFVGILIWTYLRKRWIRIGLIGTVVTGFFVIPGMHLAIEKIGPAQGIDWKLSDPDVPAAIVGVVAIIALAILEWPYSKGDYEAGIHERAERRAGIMRTATRLVMQQHIGNGIDLDTIAAENNIASADLYAALHCALEVQAFFGNEDE